MKTDGFGGRVALPGHRKDVLLMDGPLYSATMALVPADARIVTDVRIWRTDDPYEGWLYRPRTASEIWYQVDGNRGFFMKETPLLLDDRAERDRRATGFLL